ncbi:MAG: alpha/beta fold hydrolase [Bacteroidetes bacterium]|nr:alpha/beta fold hydrolase [Bacteroidota bacterium]
MRTKPSILLLHGALGAASQFDKLEGLLSSEFDVHRYDFPGHGGKAFAEHPLTMPILAEHLLDHISEFHLIGTSVFRLQYGRLCCTMAGKKQNRLLLLHHDFRN